MRFEYNGNLLEEDRINLVAKEIIDKYPQISIEKAQKAAMLEGKISEPKTLNDELNRLYNIMLVNSDNKNIVTLIYIDYLILLTENTPIYSNHIYLSEEINNFLQNYNDFPLPSNY